MKIKPTNKCDLCINLYWTCPRTKRLWERLKGILHRHTNIDLKMKPEICLLGLGKMMYASREQNILIHILCMPPKHYIHVCKCNEKAPCIEGLKGDIRKTYRIEKNLARNINTPNMVNTIWGDLVNWLEQAKP